MFDLTLETFLEVVYLLIGIAVIWNVIKRSSKFAAKLQISYIEQSKKGIINRPEQFEGKFFFIMLRIGIIFSSFVLMGMGYSILFGPIILN
ncbi:MAG: hypothetical protein JWN18_231 [Parcubacteria group bacterium]|nr:hypothetical protein [Parcubacteria group bacterium]